MLIKHCLYCGTPILPKHDEFLCPSCAQRIESAKFDSFMVRCAKCGFPKVSDDYNCLVCKKYPDLEICPIFDYTGFFARSFLELYKFDGHKEFAKFFAGVLKLYLKPEQIVIPIPSSFASVKKRGWDQMLEITKYLKNRTCRLLKNREYTEIQSKQLTKEQREDFAKDKFVLSETSEVDKNSEIVILDDVFTTGSTINSAYRLLVNAGFSDVRAVTLYAEL